MATGTSTLSSRIGNATKSRTKNFTFDNESHYGDSSAPIVLAAGSVGTSWVKTDANTAACNVAADSAIVTGKVDVWFSAGMRYGVDCVRTVNALALDGGEGDDFPNSADASIVVSQQQQVNLSIIGTLVAMTSLMASVLCHADFQDSGSASVRAVTLQPNDPDDWDSDKEVNLWTGNAIEKVLVSNGTTTAGTFSVDVGQDSTP